MCKKVYSFLKKGREKSWKKDREKGREKEHG